MGVTTNTVPLIGVGNQGASPVGPASSRLATPMSTTMFNTGARVSEVIGVRVRDVAVGPTSSVRLHGKGRKQRSLPLWKATARAVRDWLHLNPWLQDESPLLPRRDGKPMTLDLVFRRPTPKSP